MLRFTKVGFTCMGVHKGRTHRVEADIKVSKGETYGAFPRVPRQA